MRIKTIIKEAANRNLAMILRGIISLLALLGGLYLIFVIPELREWGTGVTGFILGYWLS